MRSLEKRLTLVGEKVLEVAINPVYIRYCPTMDLLAVATVDDHVHVYRFNGQQVFEIVEKQQAKVQQIVWKPNGMGFLHHLLYSLFSLISLMTGRSISRCCIQ